MPDFTGSQADAAATSPQIRRAVRILSIPGRHHENRYFRLLLDALAEQGVVLVPARLAKLATFSFDVLHLNFPTHYISEYGLARAALSWLAGGAVLVLARLAGRRIVYTVHDVAPLRVRHPRLQASFTRLVHALTDAFVFVSQSSRDHFVALFPRDAKTRWLLVPHGPYPTQAISAEERRQAREAIAGPDAFLVGFLGVIKPYKNIGALRGVPGRTADGRPIHLLVAGQAEHGHAGEVDTVLRALPPGQVTRLDRQLDNDELDRLIQTVDVVLLPYERGSNSGVALLVLSNGGRLAGSDLPIFRELAHDVGPPWAYTVADGVAAALDRVATDPVTEAGRVALRRYLDRVSFRAAAAALAGLYRGLPGSAAR